jgi:hypothetical protein
LSQSKGVLGAQVLKDPSRLKEMWAKMEQCGRSPELIHAVRCINRFITAKMRQRGIARADPRGNK